MPSTMMKVSLRTRSGPLEFLTGPLGPEMVGRGGLERGVLLGPWLREDQELPSRDLELFLSAAAFLGVSIASEEPRFMAS